MVPKTKESYVSLLPATYTIDGINKGSQKQYSGKKIENWELMQKGGKDYNKI